MITFPNYLLNISPEPSNLATLPIMHSPNPQVSEWRFWKLPWSTHYNYHYLHEAHPPIPVPPSCCHVSPERYSPHNYSSKTAIKSFHNVTVSESIYFLVPNRFLHSDFFSANISKSGKSLCLQDFPFQLRSLSSSVSQLPSAVHPIAGPFFPIVKG